MERALHPINGLAVLGLTAIAALGAASAFAPGWMVFGLLILSATVVVRRWPLALVGFYAIFEPLQPLLLTLLPEAARYFDEVLLLSAAVIFVGPRLLQRPMLVFEDPFILLTTALAGWNVVSAAAGAVPIPVALSGIFVTLDYLLLLLVLRSAPLGPRSAQHLVVVVVLLGLVAGFVGGAQHVMGADFKLSFQVLFQEGAILRVPSLFRHPNDFGYYMLHAVFIAIAAAVTTRRPIFGVVAALCGVGLVLSISRSSYLAAFVGLAVGGILANGRLLRILLLGSLVAATLLGPLFLGGIQARIDKVRAEGGDARLTYLVQSAPILASQPLLGVGPGRFGGEVARRFGSPVHEAHGLDFYSWSTVDSFWLHLAVESGIPGLLLMMTLLAVAFRRTRDGYRRAEDPWVRTLLLGATMATASHFIVNATSMALEANNIAGHLWLIVGVALSTGGDRLVSETRSLVNMEASCVMASALE